ncbi:RNA dependent RNA polymerase-domain-containing protein [Paraphoma chrysanthemicola]|uniref:RNA-dependent RNA polymerase n=1 Tax=Paraphoma chrysanthemicola TaxID=798071 RepID=A0A8K0VSY1_9PLEO|nr:RNA dependent RNA polymerase-domain-containing protein [Paraphoma chrysanthemicola]
MNHGYGGYQQRGGQGRGGRGGHRGGRGDSRKYSGSSGSSNGQGLNRPVLQQTSAPRGRDAATSRTVSSPVRVDSPHTPSPQHSSFTMNGNNFKETYTPSGSAITSSLLLSASPSTPSRRNAASQSYSPTPPRTSKRLFVERGTYDWAFGQQTKIKLQGVPKDFWVKHVYEAVCRYGSVVKIDMETGMRDNNAWVTFQPSLSVAIPQQIQFKRALVRSDTHDIRIPSVPSPIDPSKQYPEFNIIYANSIDFGTRDADMSMILMHTTQAAGKVQLKLDLDRKELDIQFPMTLGKDKRRLRFNLPIARLSGIYTEPTESGETAFIIPFDSPPRFFVQKHEGEHLIKGGRHTSFSGRDKKWTDWNTWFRETDVVDSATRKRLQDLPLSDRKDEAIIDIGRWTTYRLSIDDQIISGDQFQTFASALADHGVTIRHHGHFEVKDRIVSPLPALLQDEISGTHPHLETSEKQLDFDELFAGQFHLQFPVRYQLEVCLSNGYLKEHTITSAFLERLTSLDPIRAVHILEKIADKQHVYYDPMEIFNIRVKGRLERKVPSYCILQRSAIITPTMIHVASPIMETSNRIIRKYAADADRFIRIKFSDEKSEGPLRSMPNERAEATFNRVRNAMKNGIVVAGRFYEFLAFGNSQFREHGAYFYAPTSSKSADDIRLSLGQFDHIKTVAKFGARLGQCFSTTRTMRINVNIVKIHDVERNGHCFTDGVGRLSLFLAQMAAQELGLSNPFDDPPSLFQFRLGGCKGVLALDPKITGPEVHIRPSQQKFEAVYTGLEIIRSSAFATPFFNRQIVMVLSTLGVPNNVFIMKQREMVKEYERAMTDADTAVSKLRKHIDMNETTLSIAGMVIDGFMNDPFVKSLLNLWRAFTIKKLKEKARIAIEDGAFVLGCVDETATLKGHLNDPQSRLDASREEKLASLPEIFLQVSDASKKKGHYKIIEGICLLARNPSLHPGDLRVVRAVDVPSLHHLKNVVVLPQTGDRDLANMCSGGDLDGDDYMVLWDEDLVPQIINEPPMDFTPEEMPIERDGPITIDDIGEFFVTYMENGSLGQIAYAHLAQADDHADGVKDDTCLQLAKLHSQAVDYPKSGIPAKLSQELKPRKWPHFMEKKHLKPDQVYKSTNILGMLYDEVQLVDFKPHWDEAFDKRILEAFDLDDTTLAKAEEIKDSYDDALRRLMAKHGLRTEFEAWSVFVLDHNHESGDYKFAEEFGRTIGALKSHYKGLCREAAGVTSADTGQLGVFVAAMYTIAARQTGAALEECRLSKIVGGEEVPVRLMSPEHMPLISFPWLFATELGKIAAGCTISQASQASQTEVAHRQRPKHKDVTRVLEPVGTVETDEGITRYGELLKLDFGAQPTPAAMKDKMEKPESSKDEAITKTNQEQEQDRDREEKQKKGKTQINSKGYGTDEDKTQGQTQGVDKPQEQRNVEVREVKERQELEQMQEPNRDFQQEETYKEVKLSGNKLSAVGRLMGLGGF